MSKSVLFDITWDLTFGYKFTALKKSFTPCPREQGHGGLFLKDAKKKVPLTLFNAYLVLSFMPTQAGRSTSPATYCLSGLAVPKFDVKLPAPRIEAYLCGLLKEIPMALPVSSSGAIIFNITITKYGSNRNLWANIGF